ncbi:MAG: hypothetical protein JSS57_04715 [Proteobacteria bacterium]|nr:hypothetical protein [Pseudomonadota bacterium]
MKLRRTALAVALLSLLNACGGGGGGAATPPGGPPQVCVALPAEATLHPADAGASEWNDVLVDGSNRIWLAGYDRGVVGQTSLEPAGNARGMVRMLSNTGDLQFDSGSRFDSPGADVVEALALTASGTLYAVGRTTGVLAGTANRGQFDAFVASTDANRPSGDWGLTQFGDEFPQHPRRLVAMSDSDLYIGGYNDDYIPTNYVAAWADSFAYRLRAGRPGDASSIATVWSHRSNSDEQDYASSLAVAPDGSVFIGGVVTSGSNRGAFVRKLDGNGTTVWTARYTTSGVDNVAFLKPLSDGSVLMLGTVMGSFRGGVSIGNTDVFVARINPLDGSVITSAQLGTSGAEWLSDAKLDSQGNLFLFGETTGSFIGGKAPAGASDLFLLKVRNDGAVLRAWQWGTAGDERGASVAIDGCGRAVAAGSSTKDGQRQAVLWYPQGQ